MDTRDLLLVGAVGLGAVLVVKALRTAPAAASRSAAVSPLASFQSNAPATSFGAATSLATSPLASQVAKVSPIASTPTPTPVASLTAPAPAKVNRATAPRPTTTRTPTAATPPKPASKGTKGGRLAL